MENPAAGNGAPPPKKAALKTSVWLGLPPSEHPKKTELYKYKDVDARQAHLALLTYIDLAEAKNWLDMGVIHLDFLQLTCIVGREAATRPLELVLPHAADRPLQMDRLQLLFDRATDPNDPSQGLQSLVFGFMTDDSTSVYYRMYNGIQPPKKSLILANADIDDDES
eukprot:m.49376 g.49376  ORF g.49376 m.49376 type:complete len:167 (+) comp13351_c0_seq10:1601-2101(+)